MYPKRGGKIFILGNSENWARSWPWRNQFSELMIPYLHAENQKICLRGQGWVVVTQKEPLPKDTGLFKNLDPCYLAKFGKLEAK